MDTATRIAEAHGLWELSVARVAALVELFVTPVAGPVEPSLEMVALLATASKDERAAFVNWQRVSKECGA